MAVLSRPVVENGFTVIKTAHQTSLREKIMIMVNYLSATGLAPAMVLDQIADECIIGPVQYTNTLDGNRYKFCGALADAVNLSGLDLHKTTSDDALPTFVNDSQATTEIFAPVHIPRPRNSWIIFRQTQSACIRKNNPGLTAGDVSRIAATMWKTASPDVHKQFYDLAAEEAEWHRAMYPNYRYGGGVRKVYPAAGHEASKTKYIGEHLIANGI